MTITEKPSENPLTDTKKNNRNFSPFAHQLLAASGPIFTTVTAGMTSGYSAILLPQLQLADSAIPIGTAEASWIASMAALPMAFGCLLGGVLMERYGRRTTVIALNVPFVVGWLTISLAHSIETLLLGRFLTGLCVGLLGAPGAVYIGETASPRWRGLLLAAVSLAISLGILLAHLFGTWLSWQRTAMLCGSCSLLSFVLMTLAPESPAWLLASGRTDEAAFAFRWLRGSADEDLREFDGMLQAHDERHRLREQSKAECDGGGIVEAWRNVRRNAGRASFVRPLGILIGFFVMMQSVGVNAVAFYSVAIMRQTIGPSVNEYLAMLVIDGVRLVMSAVACVLLRMMGRRPLAQISALGTAASLFALAAFLWIGRSHGERIAELGLSWLPLVALIGYICFVSVGVVPLPWCMTGELFPVALRGFGSSIVSSVNFVCFFAVVKTGPLLFDGIGADGTFFGYGCVALLGAGFLYVCLPETRNRTLQDIENRFEGKE